MISHANDNLLDNNMHIMSSLKVSGNPPKIKNGQIKNLLMINRRSTLAIKSILLFFCLLVVSFNSFGQTVGDYRSNGDGSWSTLSTWRRWNGANWNNAPTAGQGYP